MIYKVYKLTVHFPKWIIKPMNFHLACRLHLNPGALSSFQLLQAMYLKNVAVGVVGGALVWSQKEVLRGKLPREWDREISFISSYWVQ